MPDGIFKQLTRDERTFLLQHIDELPPAGASEPDHGQLLTTSQAAAEAQVEDATIRKWVSRGVLSPQRKDDQGRNWFRPSDVQAAANRVRSRTRRPVKIHSSKLDGRDLNRLLTAREAADLLGVSPSTIRTWAHRRLIEAVMLGGHPRYTLGSLIRMIERNRRPNGVKPWLPSSDWYAVRRAIGR